MTGRRSRSKGASMTKNDAEKAIRQARAAYRKAVKARDRNFTPETDAEVQEKSGAWLEAISELYRAQKGP